MIKKIIITSVISILLISGVVIWYARETSLSGYKESEKPTLTAQTKEISIECSNALSKQSQYLETEILSEKYFFEKYPVNDVFIVQPVDLDINSEKSAREFRTMLRQELQEKGVNFAGHYSIVSVGMTGWGDNYWIIDRSNGKAYIFPYISYGLDFRKDSNLIIMDSKPLIQKALAEGKYYNDLCSDWGFGAQEVPYSDLRPFYFLWEDNRLKLLGPTSIKPPISRFWDD